MTPPIENFRLFSCIANSLEDGCLPRIGAANDKDAKTRGERSKNLCLSPLSFYIICFLEFIIGKRHLSLGCLRWWKWWKVKINAQDSKVTGILFGHTKGVTSLAHFMPTPNLFQPPAEESRGIKPGEVWMKFPMYTPFKDPWVSCDRFSSPLHSDHRPNGEGENGWVVPKVLLQSRWTLLWVTSRAPATVVWVHR